MKRLMALLALVLLAHAALAEAPEASARPVPRPDAEALAAEISAVLASVMAPAVSPRPALRPQGTGQDPAAIAAAVAAATAPAPQDPIAAFVRSLGSGGSAAPQAVPAPTMGDSVTALAIARSPRPEARPRGFARIVRAAARGPRVATSRAGSVCGVAAIKGVALAPVPGPGACGIPRPVKLSAVSGVKLNMQPTIDCTTAKALNDWVRGGVIPAVGRRGGGVAGLDIIAAYSCRTRNSKPGAKLSEHSFGHAVDVAGVVLKDGTELTVLDDWKGRNAKILRAMHTSACGPFGTVLGPNSDRYHYNHFHLDTARYRGGPYCR